MAEPASLGEGKPERADHVHVPPASASSTASSEDTIADADEDETAADAEADGEDADAEADDEEDPAASGSAAENTTGSSAAKADPAAVTAPVKVGGCGCRRSTAFEPPLTLQFLLGANLDSYRRSGSGTKRRPSTYS